MAVTTTGTPTAIIWATGANPASQDITIPSDTTAVYMFWIYYLDASGHGLSSATLNSISPNQTYEEPTVNGVSAGMGVAIWYTPATGTRTLQVVWDATPTEGPTCIVVYVKGGDLVSYRGVDAFSGLDTDPVSVTIASETGDLVLKFDERFDASAVPPSLSSGWTNGQTTTGTLGDEVVRLSYITATGATQVCNCEDESFSKVIGISIPVSQETGTGPKMQLLYSPLRW